MSEGYVYILTNRAMPGLVKIGKTTRNPKGRAQELFTTGVPEPFEVFQWFKSPNCGALEEAAHARFDFSRTAGNREFFACRAEFAASEIRKLQLEQVQSFVTRYLGRGISLESEKVVSAIRALAQECNVSELDYTDFIAAIIGQLTRHEVMHAFFRAEDSGLFEVNEELR